MNMNFIFLITLFVQGCSLFGMGCMENLPLKEDFPRKSPKTLHEMTIEAIARDERQLRGEALKRLPAELRDAILARREQYKRDQQSFSFYSCL